MKKKLLALGLTVALALGLVACASNTDTQESTLLPRPPPWWRARPPL